MKRYHQAIADFDKAIELSPDQYFYYFRRAKAKFELGQYQETITDLDTAIQLYPNDDRNYLLRGNAKEQIGDLEGAKSDLEKALTLHNLTRIAWRVDKIKSNLQRIEKRIAERK